MDLLEAPQQGGATADDIVIKTSHPWCLLYSDPVQPVLFEDPLVLETELSSQWASRGHYSPSEGTSIAPGAELMLGVLLYFPEPGGGVLWVSGVYQSRESHFKEALTYLLLAHYSRYHEVPGS